MRVTVWHHEARLYLEIQKLREELICLSVPHTNETFFCVLSLKLYQYHLGNNLHSRSPFGFCDGLVSFFDFPVIDYTKLCGFKGA